MHGLILDEPEVVEAMNANPDSPVIPKVYKKDGTVLSTAQAYPLDTLQGVMNYSRQKAARLADDLFDGRIAISPAVMEKSSWSACQWCHYRDICGADPLLEGWKERKIDLEQEKKDLVQQMAK